MYNAFLQRTKETISALSKHIHASDRYRTAVFDSTLRCVGEISCFDPLLVSVAAAPDRIEWRIIDHCAAVTRIYAIYEQFVHEMIREHLSLLQSRMSFPDLPEKIKLSYRLGLAKILEKKEGPRFGDLDLSKLINSYNQALTGKNYTLEPRAMLMQEQNLRLPELERFMSACGIDNALSWIEQHDAVKKFFAGQNRLTASATSEMAELIEYRNDAAHGSIDIGDILHINVLLEFCEFVTVVCEALAERIQLAGLKSLKIHNHSLECGKISESLKGGKVAIGEMTGAFKIGGTVYLCGENYCLERNIVSLQVDSVDREELNLTVATEIGIMFDASGKKNAIIMMMQPFPIAMASVNLGGSTENP